MLSPPRVLVPDPSSVFTAEFKQELSKNGIVIPTTNVLNFFPIISCGLIIRPTFCKLFDGLVVNLDFVYGIPESFSECWCTDLTH